MKDRKLPAFTETDTRTGRIPDVPIMHLQGYAHVNGFLYALPSSMKRTIARAVSSHCSGAEMAAVPSPACAP